MPQLACGDCGHIEEWEHGDYFGERTNFDHHRCGQPRTYERCGSSCDHSFPGCSLVLEHLVFMDDREEVRT